MYLTRISLMLSLCFAMSAMGVPKKYNLRCSAKDYKSPNGLIESEVTGLLVVDGNNYSIENFSTHYFEYEKNFFDSIKESKRPSDTFSSFGYAMEDQLKFDPKYTGGKGYPNHVQFKFRHDGIPWGNNQSAEFKFPKITSTDDLKKPANVVAMNLHYDQGWSKIVYDKCSLSEEK